MTVCSHCGFESDTPNHELGCPVGRGEAVADCRGELITVGCKVVVATRDGRLHERTVKRFERPGRPDWWVDIRFEGGDYTTPERCAVVA